MKNLIKYLSEIASFIMLALFVWAIFSFVLKNGNTAEWAQATRAKYIAVVLLLYVISAAMSGYNKAKIEINEIKKWQIKWREYHEAYVNTPAIKENDELRKCLIKEMGELSKKQGIKTKFD